MSEKKTHVSVGIGTVSLLLVLAVLSMSLLVVLSVLSAHNDSRLTERAVDIARIDQVLYGSAEELRAALTDAANTGVSEEETAEEMLERILPLLPEDAETGTDTVSFMQTDGARMLKCTLRAERNEGLWRFVYTQRKLFAETGEEEWN